MEVGILLQPLCWHPFLRGNALIRALHAYNTYVQVKEPQCWHRHVCMYIVTPRLTVTPSWSRRPLSPSRSLPLLLSIALFPLDYPCRAAYRGTYTILALPQWPSKLWSLSNYLTSFQTGPRLSTLQRREVCSSPFLPEVICLQLGSSPSLRSQWGMPRTVDGNSCGSIL